MGEDAVQAERSSAITPHESQDLVVPSPSPTQSSPTHSLNRAELAGGEGGGAAAAAMPISPTLQRGTNDGQVNAITVLTLLDKLVHMLDTVQENQHKMEQRQAEMETAVRGIQSDMTKLSKCHTSTSNSVSKLLEKSRKVSVTMKEVKDKMDKQAVQVKKLEANHAHLLKRNHFKVLIFQEENEIPASVFVKDPAPYPRDAEEEGPVSPPADANRFPDDALQTINLSSDEELGPDEDDDEAVACHDMTLEHMEKSRAEKIKRSSLKKVDSLKKAFSRQNIEKKMNKLGTKIVSQEQREKIKKSFTPNHQKSPTAKSSTFKVSPLTFNVKKVRDGEGPGEPEATSPTAAVELALIGNPDEDVPFTEVHTELAPGLEEDKAVADSLEKEEEELRSPSSSGLEADLSITENGNLEYALSATLPQEDPKPAEEEEEKKEEEDKKEEEEEEEEEEAAEGEEAKKIPTEEVPLNEAS